MRDVTKTHTEAVDKYEQLLKAAGDKMETNKTTIQGHLSELDAAAKIMERLRRERNQARIDMSTCQADLKKERSLTAVLQKQAADAKAAALTV